MILITSYVIKFKANIRQFHVPDQVANLLVILLHLSTVSLSLLKPFLPKWVKATFAAPQIVQKKN